KSPVTRINRTVDTPLPAEHRCSHSAQLPLGGWGLRSVPLKGLAFAIRRGHNMYSKCRTSTWLLRPAAVIFLSTGMDAATALAADDEQPGGLQEIVVTATRREESLSRVP